MTTCPCHPERPSLHLEISAQVGARYAALIRPHLLQAHLILSTSVEQLSLALVNDRTMSRLHKQYMDIPGPTDVLTFELEHDAKGRVTSGEVIVCVPEARRQAKQRGVSVEKELLLYALHGMLHLCGFDDRTPSDYRKMHRKEDQILTRLGIGPVFAAEGAPRRPARAVAAGAGKKKGK